MGGAQKRFPIWTNQIPSLCMMLFNWKALAQRLYWSLSSKFITQYKGLPLSAAQCFLIMQGLENTGPKNGSVIVLMLKTLAVFFRIMRKWVGSHYAGCQKINIYEMSNVLPASSHLGVYWALVFKRAGTVVSGYTIHWCIREGNYVS